MNIKNILSKTMPSIIVIALMLLSGSMIVMVSNASPSGTASFTFPYSYGTPTIPKDVGAQGIQGPTIPLSQIGLDGHSVGYTGHPGPVNDSNPFIFSNVPTVQVSVQVYNGTVSSHVVGADQEVYMYNTTTAIYAKGGLTNSLGKITFNVTKGYWQLGVNGTTGFIGFMDLVKPMSASSYSVYLIPTSYSSVSVSNGGSGTIWYTTGPDISIYNPIGFPDLNVTLENASSSDAVLKTGVTGSNGTVEFTDVNTAYSYVLVTYGFDQSLSGWTYYMGNSTSSSLSFGTSTVISKQSTGPDENSGGAYAISTAWSTTGNVTGFTFPTKYEGGGGAICLTKDSTIKGGVTYFGNNILTNGYKLTFINAIVYLNTSYYHNFNAINSTIIGIAMHYNGVSIHQSDMHITAVHSFLSFNGGADQMNPYPYVNDSILCDIPDSYSGNYNSITQEALSYNGDAIMNTQLSSVPLHLTNSTIINSEVGYSFSSVIAYVNYSITGNKFIDSAIYMQGKGYLPDNITVDYNSFFNTTHWISTDTLAFDLKGTASITNNNFVSGSFSILNITTGSKPTSNDYVIWDENNFSSAWSSSAIVARQANMTNDIFTDPMTSGAYAYRQFLTTSATPLIDVDGNATITHSLVNWTGSQSGSSSVFMEPGVIATYNSFMNVSHVLFDRVVSPGALFFSSWIHFSFQNNTLKNGYGNMTLMHEECPGYTPPNGGSPIDIYPAVNFITSNVISNNSFYSMLFGTGVPDLVGVLSPDAYATISNNIFDPVEHLANSSLVNAAIPSSTDIITYTAKEVNITGNYFLDSNNVTKPIFIASNYNGTEHVPFTTNINGNHIYMGRFPGYPDQILSTSTSGNYTYLSYVIPRPGISPPTVNYEGTGTYMYLSSSIDTPAGGIPGTSNFTPYVFTPDVIDNGNSLMISYANGYAGGPQPNFTWKGYNYSESVEPTYIQVGVNSSKAPNVTLQYNNLYKKTLYIAYIYTNGVIYKDWAFNSNSSSTYNVTYDPATMPLDPTIVVIPWTPTSPNPPPLTPIIVNAGNSILQFIEQPYVLIPLIILIVAAVVLVSTGRRKY